MNISLKHRLMKSASWNNIILQAWLYQPKQSRTEFCFCIIEHGICLEFIKFKVFRFEASLTLSPVSFRVVPNCTVDYPIFNSQITSYGNINYSIWRKQGRTRQYNTFRISRIGIMPESNLLHPCDDCHVPALILIRVLCHPHRVGARNRMGRLVTDDCHLKQTKHAEVEFARNKF